MPGLQFKGKEFVFNHHLTVPYRPLVADAQKSVGAGDMAGNLVIHGDNLEALKALLPVYAGKVDCHKNAQLWRNAADGVALDLLVLAFLRSQKSILQWRGDVLNRKGTLAVKTGWVHRTKFDFSAII